ncbi:2TM domain-containing protein [Flavobacterium sp.]|uniref:2TM domain-containing protein n=1 Tax=Flavobacterium sp. TaxID=239 RepID=UPI00374D19F6
MGRYRRHMYEDYKQELSTDESYNIAFKKVKRIKGFYSHLRVFVIVNAIILIANFSRNYTWNNVEIRGFENWQSYSTLFYWGIALLIHAFTVFGPDIFFNRDWEQKKIQKFMDKDAQNKNKWE